MLKRITLFALVCAAVSLVVLQAAAAAPGTVTCSGPFSGTARDLIVTSASGNCIVDGATITHDLIVDENGFVNVFNTAIAHDLIATKPSVVTTGFTEDGGGPVTVGHDLMVSGPLTDQFGNHSCCPGINDATVGHDLRITDLLVDFELFVQRDRVGHDLVVSGNTTGICCGFGPIAVGDNNVGHDLAVTNNTAPGGDFGWISVFENRVGHGAICSGNSPAVSRNTQPELDWFGRSVGPNEADHSDTCP
jgi:hypothetical protein